MYLADTHALPDWHQGPFDRMLVAQALAEDYQTQRVLREAEGSATTGKLA